MDGGAGRAHENKSTKTMAPVRFSAEDFAEAVQLVAPALPGINITQPRLELMDYRGHAALMARCIDLEVLVRIGNADPVPSLVLPGQAFKKFFRRGKTAADVIISAVGETALTVELDGMIAQFEHENVDAWGEPRLMLEPPLLHVERKTLAHALGLCAPAISTEETRYYLNGVCLAPHPADETALIFCATDGHRLVKHVVQGVTHSLEKAIIIPSAAVKLLRTLLAKMKDEEPVEVSVALQAVTFSCGEFYLQSKLIDGTFPQFERVIPRDCPLLAEIHVPSLRSFLKRMKALQGSVVQLQIDRKLDALRVAWRNSELGQVTLRLDGHAAADMNISFQIRYLLDVLGQLSAEHITVSAASESSPAIFATAGELADPSTTIVVMPMRV